MSKYSENMPPDIEGAIGWLLKYIKPDTSFLDVGCSTGYFGGFVKDHKGINVDGIEISEDIKLARQRLDRVFSFDVDKPWPKLNKRYDYIYFGDVLEHLKNPSAALVEAEKALAKKGLIFVSIPNIAHISIRLELLRGRFVYEPMGILDNTHLQYFTKDTFIEVAQQAGFMAELVDFTENDMPKEIINEYLAEAGLKASPKFHELSKQLESRAYQYKFLLRRGGIDEKPKTHKLDKPLQYRDNHIGDLQKQIDTIHTHADKQAEIIKFYTEKSAHLEEQNKALLRRIEKQNKILDVILPHRKLRKVAGRAKRKLRKEKA